MKFWKQKNKLYLKEKKKICKNLDYKFSIWLKYFSKNMR